MRSVSHVGKGGVSTFRAELPRSVDRDEVKTCPTNVGCQDPEAWDGALNPVFMGICELHRYAMYKHSFDILEL